MINKSTYHARQERTERIARILIEVGSAENPIQEYTERDSKGRFCRKTLNNLGILAIYNDHNELVTMYLATLKQARLFFADGRLPKPLYKTITRNLEKFPEIYEMKG